MVDSGVMKSVQNYLHHLKENGLDVRFGVVFGSQARGQGNVLSDIDLIVVSPEYDESITRDSINQLWRTAARTDSRIEPLPCGLRQWQEDTSEVILEIARQDGVSIPAA